MNNKKKTISIRIDDKQYSILETNSHKLNMTVSDYIRHQIDQAPEAIPDHRQQISSIMCRLYILLQEHGLEDETIAKEVHQLCQM